MAQWRCGIMFGILVLISMPCLGQTDAARYQQHYEAFLNVLNDNLPFLTDTENTSGQRETAFRAYEQARQTWCTTVGPAMQDADMQTAFGNAYQQYCVASPPPFHATRDRSTNGPTTSGWDPVYACSLWRDYLAAETDYNSAGSNPLLAWFWDNNVRPDRRYQNSRPDIDQAVVRLYEAGEARRQAEHAAVVYENQYQAELGGRSLESFCSQQTTPLEVGIYLSAPSLAPGQTLHIDSGVAPPNTVITTYQWQIDGQSLQGMNQSSWELADPPVGTHTIRLTVTTDQGTTASSEARFSVGSRSFSLTASTDKTVYITGETITITGRLTGDATAVMRVPVQMQITRSSGAVITSSLGTVTSANGSFTASFTIPKQPVTATARPDTWQIALSVQPTGAQQAAQTTLQVQVAPVFIVLHEVRLVQVVEAPMIQGVQHLAAGRKGVLRVVLSCPSLKGVAGASKPKVLVRFDAGIGSRDVLFYDTEVEVGPDETPIDLPFVLDEEGSYLIGAMVDHDFRYTRPEDSDQMFKGVQAQVKKMKRYALRFVPIQVYTGYFGKWEERSNPDLVRFLAFVKRQEDFIRTVYPLPDAHLKVDAEYRSQEPNVFINYQPITYVKQYELIAALNLRGALTGSRWIGVLPDEQRWWPDATTYGSAYYLAGAKGVGLFFESAALVRYERLGAFIPEGVTAHEFAHTLGLYRGTEEYDMSGVSPYGRQVQHLIQRGERVYDLSDPKEVTTAFGLPGPNRAGREQGEVYCFMGFMPATSEPGYQNVVRRLGLWVCEHTYAELFKVLKDPPPTPMIYVSGQIARGVAHLNPIYEIQAEPGVVHAGDYTLEMQDALGIPLGRAFFGNAAYDTLHFGLVVPQPAGTARLVIKRGDQVLGLHVRTPHRPEVRLQPLPQPLPDMLLLRWSTTDADGDPLVASVLYSADDGTTWTALSANQTTSELSIPVSELPGGNRGRFKIIVTDGFNTAETMSPPIVVPDQPPMALLFTPPNADTVTPADTVRFSGAGFDAEDGSLTHDRLSWHSTVQGLLGTGSELATTLQPGLHEVTLRATDRAGQVAEASVSVRVEDVAFPPPPPPPPSDIVHKLGHGVNEAGIPVGVTTLFMADATVHSWVQLPDASAGEQLHWTFTTPTGISHEINHTVDWNGPGSAYAFVDLATVGEVAEGFWQVSVTRNGVTFVQDSFEVMSLGGFFPWGGAVGIGLVLGGILVVGWLFKKMIGR